MNDYKELIEDLRLGLTCGPYRAVTVLKSMLSQAADAIERLCTDVARLEAENRAKEQYIAETIGKVIKERDAAIAEIDGVCLNCAHSRRYNGGEMCEYIEECSFSEKDKNPSKWEWRGVREVEHG